MALRRLCLASAAILPLALATAAAAQTPDYEVGGFGAATSRGFANTYHGPPRVVGLSVRAPFGS